MKKILSILAVIMMVAFVSSCAPKNPQEFVEQINKDCPYDQDGMTITKASLEGNCVAIYCDVDDNVVMGAAMVPDQVKKSLVDAIKADATFSVLKENNCGVKYVFKGKTSGETVDVAVEPSEM